MKTATVTFHNITQEKHDLATSDPNAQHMVSKASFTLLVSETFPNLSVTLRQPYGTDYATEPVEVEKPVGKLPEKWNHNAFRDAVEEYYRDFIGDRGKFISIGSGVQNLHMEGNVIVSPKSYTFPLPD